MTDKVHGAQTLVGYKLYSPGQIVMNRMQAGWAASRLGRRGSGPVFNRLYSDKFGAIAISLPPSEEQSAIVRYLDHIDRRIRRYIRAKQKLIVLLNEQKQAIILQAGDVVPLTQASGSSRREWGGWGKCRSIGISSATGSSSPSEIKQASLLCPFWRFRSRPVFASRIRDCASEESKSDRDKYKRAAQGDIAYNMMRMWQAPSEWLVSMASLVQPT